MIILDTNVISELMKSNIDEHVSDWVSVQDPVRLALTTITIAEIQRGLANLPDGKRQKKLFDSFENFTKKIFTGRIFAFDEKAANIY